MPDKTTLGAIADCDKGNTAAGIPRLRKEAAQQRVHVAEPLTLNASAAEGDGDADQQHPHSIINRPMRHPPPPIERDQ